MGMMDIDSIENTSMNNVTYGNGDEPWNKNDDSFNIDSKDTEQSMYMVNWPKWHGFYRSIPMLQAVINKMAIWVVGKGYETQNKNTKKILDAIRGNGKDTINGILNNAVRTYKIGGDFFAEIIRRGNGGLVNLKPLNPGTIKIVANEKGIITKYEQVASTNPDEKALNKWDPKDMFHLSNMRIADEIHGIPTIEKLQKIIKRWEQAMADLSVVFHRYVKPFLLIKVDTDDPTEIDGIITKLNNSFKNMENMVVPKDALEVDRVSIPQFSTLDPLPWITFLQTYFILTEGVPDVILGDSKESAEATAKIIYLAFQQTIEWEQLYIQDQIKAQLGLEINLKFPASIDPSLLTDARKNTGDSVKKINPASEKKT